MQSWSNKFLFTTITAMILVVWLLQPHLKLKIGIIDFYESPSLLDLYAIYKFLVIWYTCWYQNQKFKFTIYTLQRSSWKLFWDSLGGQTKYLEQFAIHLCDSLSMFCVFWSLNVVFFGHLTPNIISSSHFGTNNTSDHVKRPYE